MIPRDIGVFAGSCKLDALDEQKSEQRKSATGIARERETRDEREGKREREKESKISIQNKDKERTY